MDSQLLSLRVGRSVRHFPAIGRASQPVSCPCGEPITTKFCIGCGKATSSISSSAPPPSSQPKIPKNCSCGTPVDPNKRYCIGCGTFNPNYSAPGQTGGQPRGPAPATTTVSSSAVHVTTLPPKKAPTAVVPSTQPSPSSTCACGHVLLANKKFCVGCGCGVGQHLTDTRTTQHALKILSPSKLPHRTTLPPLRNTPEPLIPVTYYNPVPARTPDSTPSPIIASIVHPPVIALASAPASTPVSTPVLASSSSCGACGTAYVPTKRFCIGCGNPVTTQPKSPRQEANNPRVHPQHSVQIPTKHVAVNTPQPIHTPPIIAQTPEEKPTSTSPRGTTSPRGPAPSQPPIITPLPSHQPKTPREQTNNLPPKSPRQTTNSQSSVQQQINHFQQPPIITPLPIHQPKSPREQTNNPPPKSPRQIIHHEEAPMASPPRSFRVIQAGPPSNNQTQPPSASLRSLKATPTPVNSHPPPLSPRATNQPETPRTVKYGSKVAPPELKLQCSCGSPINPARWFCLNCGNPTNSSSSQPIITPIKKTNKAPVQPTSAQAPVQEAPVQPTPVQPTPVQAVPVQTRVQTSPKVEPITTHCTKCGASIKPTPFCIGCGKKQTEAQQQAAALAAEKSVESVQISDMKCTCGHSVDSNSKFCIGCGKKKIVVPKSEPQKPVVTKPMGPPKPVQNICSCGTPFTPKKFCIECGKKNPSFITPSPPSPPNTPIPEPRAESRAALLHRGSDSTKQRLKMRLEMERQKKEEAERENERIQREQRRAAQDRLAQRLAALQQQRRQENQTQFHS